MNLKVVNFVDQSDKLINKKVANLMMSQYKKGLQMKNAELQQDDATESGDEIDKVNLTTNVQLPKQKKSVAQKTYSAKSMNTISTRATNSSGTNVQDFIAKLNLLDNEVDQMITTFKLNNHKEFYGGVISEEDKAKLDNMSEAQLRTELLKRLNSITNAKKESTKAKHQEHVDYIRERLYNEFGPAEIADEDEDEDEGEGEDEKENEGEYEGEDEDEGDEEDEEEDRRQQYINAYDDYQKRIVDSIKALPEDAYDKVPFSFCKGSNATQLLHYMQRKFPQLSDNADAKSMSDQLRDMQSVWKKY